MSEPKPLPNYTGSIPTDTCLGCGIAFGPECPVIRCVPHMMDFTDEARPTVATRIPLCGFCSFRWVIDRLFVEVVDRRGMDLLEGVQHAF